MSSISMEPPTFNAVIEPHPSVIDLTTEAEPEEPPPSPIKPHRQAALVGDEIKVEKFELPSPPCCPMVEPTPTLQAANVNISNLFEALLTSFAVGALTGIAVSYALSRRVVVEFE